jgi:hypothetical protein
MSENTPLKTEDVALKTVLDLHTLLSDHLKGNITLDKKTVNILTLVLNSCPAVIDDLNHHIIKIISDNVIDSKDLPQFILMFKDVINVNMKDLKKIKVSRSDVIILIESIINILIDTNVIKTGEKKDEIKALLSLSVQILDSSVNLSDNINCSRFMCC